MDDLELPLWWTIYQSPPFASHDSWQVTQKVSTLYSCGLSSCAPFLFFTMSFQESEAQRLLTTLFAGIGEYRWFLIARFTCLRWNRFHCGVSLALSQFVDLQGVKQLSADKVVTDIAIIHSHVGLIIWDRPVLELCVLSKLPIWLDAAGFNATPVNGRRQRRTIL